MSKYCDLQPNESGPYRCTQCGKRTNSNKLKYICKAQSKDTKPLLGDHVAEVLKKFKITPESVEKLIGRKCNCEKRRILLNRLDAWARKKINKNKELL